MQQQGTCVASSADMTVQYSGCSAEWARSALTRKGSGIYNNNNLQPSGGEKVKGNQL